MVNQYNSNGVRPTLILLSVAGHKYLADEATQIQLSYGRRQGCSAILRGIVDGLAEAGFTFSDCSTARHVADKIRTAVARRVN